MSDLEIALGVLASATTLYGFVLAYYQFGRTLHITELVRYEQIYLSADPNKWQWKMDGGAARKSERDFKLGARDLHYKNLAKIRKRGRQLDWFLLGSTAAFVFSTFAIALYLVLLLSQTQEWALALGLGAGSITLLAMVVYIAQRVGLGHLKYLRIQEDQDRAAREDLAPESSWLEEPEDRDPPGP